MLECVPGEADQSIEAYSDELIDLLAEAPWPLALVTAGCRMLALRTPLRDRLGVPAEALLDRPFESLLLDDQHLQVRAAGWRDARAAANAPAPAGAASASSRDRSHPDSQ